MFACHISNKVDDLHAIVEMNSPSLIMITESWQNTNIPDSDISIGRMFNTYRRDRPTPGGGVLAYVNACIPTTCLKNLEEDNREVLWLLLKPPRTPRPFSVIVVVGVYFPPGQSAESERELIEYITRGLDSVLRDYPSAGVCIMGDFNQMKLSRLCRRFNLKKSVKAPTRGTRVLDQILTNMSDLYKEVVHLPPVGRSDHQCLLYSHKTIQTVKPSTRKLRLTKPCNLNALGLKLNLEDWKPIFEARDINNKVSLFTNTIIDILDKTIPVTTIRTHASDKPWMMAYIKKEIKARQKAYTTGNMTKYRQLADKIITLIKKAKAEFYSSKVKSKRKHDAAKWHRTISQLAGFEGDNLNNNLISNGTPDTVEILQNIFTKPWSKLPETIIPSLEDVASSLRQENPPTPSIGQVKTALKQLNSKKATGSDGIPAWVLKRYCEELAPIVHDIICASIKECEYLIAYKHALVIPVPKVNPPRDIENDFRQISILPQMAKVPEKLQLKLNLPSSRINDNQHAFTSKRSTVSALTNISQNWFNVTDNTHSAKNRVHALFIDFRKAFDLVDHGILLRKLAEMNVTKAFWLWTRSFLEERRQQIKLAGTLSSVKPCPAGVLQGSVMSPALFNIHINDIENSIQDGLSINICKYADDCTQDEVVSQGSSSHMQEALEAVQEWSNRNKMTINSKKTKDMWICFNTAIPVPEPLVIGNEVVERVNSHKLLGVWHQNNLKWNCHVKNIVTKANKRMFSLRECRRANLPPEVGIACYESKIRPVFEYAAPIWGGLPQYLIDEIESIQNRCIKILGTSRCNFETLEQRRAHLTVKEYQRILSDPTNRCNKLIPQPFTHEHDLRTTNNLPYVVSYTKRHRQSFIPRAISLLKQS